MMKVEVGKQYKMIITQEDVDFGDYRLDDLYVVFVNRIEDDVVHFTCEIDTRGNVGVGTSGLSLDLDLFEDYYLPWPTVVENE